MINDKTLAVSINQYTRLINKRYISVPMPRRYKNCFAHNNVTLNSKKIIL